MSRALIYVFLQIFLLSSAAKAMHPYRGSLDRSYTNSTSGRQSMLRLMNDWSRSWYLANTLGPSTDLRANALGAVGQSEQALCNQFYDSLFVEDSVDMQIFFGYQDYATKIPLEVGVRDPVISAALVSFLTQSCPSNGEKNNFYACGFKKNSEKQIYKDILDHRGRARRFWLTISNSALSNPGMTYNEITNQQMAQSESVTNGFIKAIRSADILFYAGHARKGGGPDFFPPRLNELGLVVDSPAYLGDGSQMLIRELSSSPKPPKVLGMIACASAQFFKKGLQGVSPATATILNYPGTPLAAGEYSASFFNDENLVLVGSINAFVGGYCPASINRMMRYPGMDPDFLKFELPIRN